MSVLCLWIIGLPTALALVYAARPSWGLVGFWWGMLCGVSLLALTYAILVLNIDWAREGRRLSYMALQSSRPPRQPNVPNENEEGSRVTSGPAILMFMVFKLLLSIFF